MTRRWGPIHLTTVPSWMPVVFVSLLLIHLTDCYEDSRESDKSYSENNLGSNSISDITKILSDTHSLEKRRSPFSFGVGRKRAPNPYGFGVGKREQNPFDFGLGKRESDPFKFGIGKRAPNPFNFGVGKRKPDPFNFGVGKRELSPFSFGVGKRELSPFSFGVGKRELSPFSFGVGRKRAPSPYDFGVGKRDPDPFNFGVGKRAPSPFDFGVGKRGPSPFDFGVGKRDPRAFYLSNDDDDVPYSKKWFFADKKVKDYGDDFEAYGKRIYSFGIGKRAKSDRQLASTKEIPLFDFKGDKQTLWERNADNWKENLTNDHPDNGGDGGGSQ
ncbi:Uncharacterised protein g7188 [Pycnogonum litorale]